MINLRESVSHGRDRTPDTWSYRSFLLHVYLLSAIIIAEWICMYPGTRDNMESEPEVQTFAE